MPDILAQVTINSATGFAEDAVVNTFAYSMPSGFIGNAVQEQALMDAINAFYTVTPPGGANSISEWLSPGLSRLVDGCQIDLYDISGHLDGSPHGSPFRSGWFQLDPSDTGFGLPREVALCVTLRGTGWGGALVESPDGPDAGSAVDRPRQRKTGRLYIGPFSNAAFTSDAPGHEGRPMPQLITDVVQSAKQHAINVTTVAAGARWCVWSRADTFLYTITDVQVDNAFDTQRRRGTDPTTRTTVSTTVV